MWERTGIAEPALDWPTPLVAEMLRVRRAAITSVGIDYYLQHEGFAAAEDNLAGLGAVIVFASAERTAAAQEYLARLQEIGETVDLLPEKHVSREFGEMNPTASLSRLAADRRVCEVSMGSPRHRDVRRRLWFVNDQARAWYGEHRGSLRDYLDWAATQEPFGEG